MLSACGCHCTIIIKYNNIILLKYSFNKDYFTTIVFCENTILRYELARTCTNNLRVVLPWSNNEAQNLKQGDRAYIFIPFDSS